MTASRGRWVWGLLVLVLACTGALAQPYSLDWWSVDGGAGTSSGGLFSLSGTIGQPDAGTTLTNGPLSLTGGFWALSPSAPAVVRPTLSIVLAGQSQARISWVPDTPGFVLQFSAALSPPAWANAPTGGTNPIILPAPLPGVFYRLFKP